MTKWAIALVLAGLCFFGAGAAAEAKEHKVEISDVKFKPAKLKVKKGDTVVWVNRDDRDHTVVAKVKDKEKEAAFDSGKIAAGEKYEHKFDKAGQYDYGCDYHPRMRGAIEVTD